MSDSSDGKEACALALIAILAFGVIGGGYWYNSVKNSQLTLASHDTQIKKEYIERGFVNPLNYKGTDEEQAAVVRYIDTYGEGAIARTRGKSEIRGSLNGLEAFNILKASNYPEAVNAALMQQCGEHSPQEKCVYSSIWYAYYNEYLDDAIQKKKDEKDYERNLAALKP
jgi:hypothetical protein